MRIMTLVAVLCISILVSNSTFAKFSSKFFDSYGNVYYAESDGYHTGKAKYKVFLDGNRVKSSSEFDVDGRFEELASEVYNGKYIDLDSVEEAEEFFNYFCNVYSLGIYGRLLWYQYEDKVKLKSYTKFDNTLEQTTKNIVDKFGLPSGENSYALIYDACKRVSKMKYDSSYVNEDLDTALTKNAGVCWHMAKYLCVLLKESGLESECVSGVYSRSDGDMEHMWVRTKIDGKWIYSDPTLFRSDERYYQVDYVTYIKNYTECSMLKSK